MGNVYVTNKAKLTIEPGTVIIADAESKASLVITKGASILAEGTETDPIVFTSSKSIRKAGDWGGILLLGEAPINKFGNVASVNFDLDAILRRAFLVAIAANVNAPFSCSLINKVYQ